MQTPEKLTLLGGSILLSSTLIFTLKSQANNIIPRVGSHLASNYHQTTDTSMQLDAVPFAKGMKTAQENGWSTGHWGTAPYYIDSDNDIYIGAGQLQGPLYSVIGDRTSRIRMVDFQQDVQAPPNAYRLMSNLPRLTDIRNLARLDTTHTTEMQGMLSSDPQLTHLDLSHFSFDRAYDTSFLFYQDTDLNTIEGLDRSDVHTGSLNLTDYMFSKDDNIKQLDFNNWDMGHVDYAKGMFAGMSGLRSLDISHFDIANPSATNDLMGYPTKDQNHIQRLTLGDRLALNHSMDISPNSQWKNGNQTLSGDQITDGSVHPGTWLKQ